MAKIRRLACGIVILALAIQARAADVANPADVLPPAKAETKTSDVKAADAKTAAHTKPVSGSDTKVVAQVADTKTATPAVEPKPVVVPPPTVIEEPAASWLAPNDSRCARLKADVGFMILTPRWNSNPALTVVHQAPPFSSQQRDFDFNAQFVPMVSLGGVMANGFGIRANWWSFAEGDRLSASTNEPGTLIVPIGSASIAGPGGATAVLTTARLRMNVWDFEFTDDVRLSQWVGLVALGVRYAHLSQDYAAGSTDLTLANETIISGHNFNGAGPTLALELHRPLGGAGLYFYGYGRGSVLFGSAKESSDITTTVVLDDTNGTLSSTSQKNPVLPVGELDFGLGWNRSISRAVLYAQVGFVGQVWWGAGNSSTDQSILSILGLDAGHHNENLGLIGLSVRTGLNF